MQHLADGKILPKLPVQIFLMWYPDRFHHGVMRLSSGNPIAKIGRVAAVNDIATVLILFVISLWVLMRVKQAERSVGYLRFLLGIWLG
jgi:hypothetical protein